MRKYLISLCCGCSLIAVTAQQKAKMPAKFTVTVQAGALKGETPEAAMQFQLLGGLKKNAWLASLGAGVDYYGSKRSMPLFLDIKNFIGKGKNNPFIYTSAGYNFSWLRQNEKFNNFWNASHSQQGGLFYDIGAGYRFALNKKMSAGFSAGYSYKQQIEIIQRDNMPCDFCIPIQQNGQTQPEQYNYQLRRLSFKMLWWF